MKNNILSITVLSMAAILVSFISACAHVDQGPVTFTVTGMVNNELSLTDAGLHSMDIVNINTEHPKNGMQDYTGIRIYDLLDRAGVQDKAITLLLIASDGYTFEIDLATVLECTDCLVAFSDIPGEYLAIMPGQTSKGWVKSLIGIEVK